MKTINNYIIEKLKINSKSNINGYDPDRLNNDSFLLYNSDSESSDVDWDDCEKELENLDYSGYFVCQYDPITKLSNYGRDITNVNTDIIDIKDEIITGKDYGYEIRYAYGHIEIDAINSGSRSTYYIYALSEEAYNKIDTWWSYPDELEGNTDEEKLQFLFEEGNIIEIKM